MREDFGNGMIESNGPMRLILVQACSLAYGKFGESNIS